MTPGDDWSIGELAERAGVSVKTVRFYSDRGLLPEARRSSGGHRRYGPDALDRLRLIRSLRGLDLPVARVGEVLQREEALEEVIACRLREVESELAALRWQEAALRLLREGGAAERAERLRLVGALGAPPDTAVLARFWRGVLPARLPRGLVAQIVEAAVPQPPADPTPSQVLAFARLHALAAAACEAMRHCRAASREPEGEGRPEVLYPGLGEAYDLAARELRAERDPVPGEALDRFVAAHADARGAADTPAFRRALRTALTRGAVPMMKRYWQLAGEVTAHSGRPGPTLGAAHGWLHAALDRQLAEAG